MKKFLVVMIGIFLFFGFIFSTAFSRTDNYVKKTTKSLEVTKIILVENDNLMVTVWFPPLQRLRVEDGFNYGFVYLFEVEIEVAWAALEYQNFVEPKFFISQGIKEYPVNLKVENTFNAHRLNRKPSKIMQGFIIFSRPNPLTPGSNEPLISFRHKFTLRCGENSITIQTEPFRSFSSFLW